LHFPRPTPIALAALPLAQSGVGELFCLLAPRFDGEPLMHVAAFLMHPASSLDAPVPTPFFIGLAPAVLRRWGGAKHCV
jgi:hypothetical protein